MRVSPLRITRSLVGTLPATQTNSRLPGRNTRSYFMRDTRIKNELGNRHGALTVVDEAPSKGRGAEWRCRCDCGNYITIRATSLRRGYNKDCGCGMGGNRKLGSALINIGTPPCDKGCSCRDHCRHEELACKAYQCWLASGVEVEPDPQNFRPTNRLFERIFK